MELIFITNKLGCIGGDNINRLDEILIFNRQFVEDKKYEEFVISKIPSKKIAILSCMDTRLTELLPKAMNIRNGDAKIIKNAGASVMHPFGSTIRSILVAIYEFNAQDVIVVGHHDCGMCNLNTDSIINKMIKRGITKETMDTLDNSGINIEAYLMGFHSVEDAIKESVKRIKNHPLVPDDVYIHGLIIDPQTGKLDIIVDGYQQQ